MEGHRSQDWKHYQEMIKPLFSAQEIEERCRILGREITEKYHGESLIVVGVLKGVFPFFADLVRHIELPCQCDFVGLSSYGLKTKTSGVVRMTSDLSIPVTGHHVLIVEDIVDTGLTMNYLLKNMKTRGPKSVGVCTLLHKPVNERIQVPLDHVGFVVEDYFVVGYGLDYQERFRNLPYIGYFEGELPVFSD